MIVTAAHHANSIAVATVSSVYPRMKSATTATWLAGIIALPLVRLKHAATAWEISGRSAMTATRCPAMAALTLARSSFVAMES